MLSSHQPWQIQQAVMSPEAVHTGLQEGMGQLRVQPTEAMEAPYPERPGEADCVYYMRTGLCGFGMSCRFNHPPNRKAADGVRGKGEYPERVGQPECQYYLRTGTCKFGETCKYNHSRDKGVLSAWLQLNILGLPFRLGEVECAYYMRTSSCKYGTTCKFHHPQPATAFIPGSSLYAPAGSPTAPGVQHYPAGIPSWPFTRGPYLPTPRLRWPTSYAPLMIPPQGMLPIAMAGWGAYQGPVNPVTPDGQQPAIRMLAQSVGAGVHGAFDPYSPVAGGSIRISSLQSQSIGGQKGSVFPERPGQPECQYYMKTGDCKFDATCRFHHPKDRTTPLPTSSLSPMGLPLRQGAQPCTYYMRFGVCKFGGSCKFDHPLGGLSSSSSASSLTDMANVSNLASSTDLSLVSTSVSPKDSGSGSVSGEAAGYGQIASKKSFEEVDGIGI